MSRLKEHLRSCPVEGCNWTGYRRIITHLYKEAEDTSELSQCHRDFIECIVQFYVEQDWTKGMLLKRFDFDPDHLLKREDVILKTRKQTAQAVVKHGNNVFQSADFMQKQHKRLNTLLEEPKKGVCKVCGKETESFKPQGLINFCSSCTKKSFKQPKIRICERCNTEIRVFSRYSSKSVCDSCIQEKEEAQKLQIQQDLYSRIALEQNGVLFFKDVCPICGIATLVDTPLTHHKLCESCSGIRFSQQQYPHIFIYGIHFKRCSSCSMFINLSPFSKDSNKLRKISRFLCDSCRAESFLLEGGFRGSNWEQQRQKALDRDNHTCQNPECIKTKEELSAVNMLDVHHIIRFRDFGFIPGENTNYIQANDLSNIICYCKSCHPKFEAHPDIAKEHLDLCLNKEHQQLQLIGV